MKKKITSKKLAKETTNLLNVILTAEANSASCFFAYQPKKPEELEKFKKRR